jgi:hypothetical protein
LVFDVRYHFEIQHLASSFLILSCIILKFSI